MSEKRKLACMEELHDVLLRYDAELYYTINDDGVHLSVDGEEAAVWFFREGLANQIQGLKVLSESAKV